MITTMFGVWLLYGGEESKIIILLILYGVEET